jgi:leucyl aminopeptidase
MPIQSIDTEPQSAATDAVVVGIFADEALAGAAAKIDAAVGGAIAKLIEAKEFEGKAGQTLPLHHPSGVASGLLLLVGLGKRDDFDVGGAYRAAGTATKWLSDKQRASAAIYLADELTEAQGEAAVVGAMVGCVGQDLYRKEKDRHPIDDLQFAGVSAAALASGEAIASSVNLTRRLVNEPAEVIYPETFAERAQEVASECGLEIDIWGKERLQKEGCGALLAVSKGSARDPRLVTLKYQGTPGAQVELALVGKGVTFDSGGLSLKPSDGMLTMKMDMAGAATMLGAIAAIAKLKLPINVVAMLGLTENMTGANAYKLGDVLTARNGKTIEVHNTDAEGRLVLADVLSLAAEMKPNKIIDAATLTGACVVALGLDVFGVMTNTPSLADEILSAAGSVDEPAWQLPMFKLFDEQIKGTISDIKNVGEGRWGGAITAAKFLEQFVDELPWAHLDIAGPAFVEKPKAWIDCGGSGVGVRTLVELARREAAG